MALLGTFGGNCIAKVWFDTILSDPKFNTAIDLFAFVELYIRAPRQVKEADVHVVLSKLT